MRYASLYCNASQFLFGKLCKIHPIILACIGFVASINAVVGLESKKMKMVPTDSILRAL